MEVRGIPPTQILEQSTRMKMFFDVETNEPLPVFNSRGKQRMPNTKPLENLLKSQSDTFLDFIKRCLDWDP